MEIKSIWLSANTKLHQTSRYFWFKKNNGHRYKILAQYNIPLRKLSKEQKREIKEYWGKLGLDDYATHELIYSITGNFDPAYCSELAFGSKISLFLNDDKYLRSWSDKNYFDKYFPNVKFPHTLLHNIAGVLYDNEYNQINIDTALSIMQKYEKVVLKPSLDSGMGTGVKLVPVDEMTKNVLESYKKDFLVQEVLEQYEPIKALNPTSVNVIRLNSLFLNGKVTYLSASLRVGAQGAFNDNSITADGKGMCVIGITDDGVLKEFAYHSCGLRIKVAPNGVPFAGLKIPNFDEVKRITTEIHSKMPFAKYIGFDIAFDRDGMPVIMEYNLNAPGIFYYQLANGPLFASRTKELIDYFKK